MVQRLVMLELAAAIVVSGWLIGPFALVPAVAVAAALVVLAVVRRRGRSLPEWLGTLLALRARTRRATPVPPGTDAGSRAGRGVRPGAADVQLQPATTATGGRSGMIGDGTFLTAVLQVESDAGALRAERSRRPLPVGLVRDALDVDGIRLESAQIVLHTQPAPALHLPQQSVAVSNYAPAAGPDGGARGAHHLDRAEARPGAVPGGGGGARRRASRGRRSAWCGRPTTWRVG